jgi:hypothetical protein
MDQERLSHEIENVRSELECKGECLALNASDLLLVSQRLDQLIYRFLLANGLPEPPPRSKVK